LCRASELLRHAVRDIATRITATSPLVTGRREAIARRGGARAGRRMPSPTEHRRHRRRAISSRGTAADHRPPWKGFTRVASGLNRTLVAHTEAVVLRCDRRPRPSSIARGCLFFFCFYVQQVHDAASVPVPLPGEAQQANGGEKADCSRRRLGK